MLDQEKISELFTTNFVSAYIFQNIHIIFRLNFNRVIFLFFDEPCMEYTKIRITKCMCVRSSGSTQRILDVFRNFHLSPIFLHFRAVFRKICPQGCACSGEFSGADPGFPVGRGADPLGGRQPTILPKNSKNCMKL